MGTPVESRVIFNPAAGRGKAARTLAEWQRLLDGRAEFCPTTHAGHAEDLAKAAAEAGCRFVAAAGGDGTVHEVANGILRAGRSDVVLVVLPVGSANDYAHTLDFEFGGKPELASEPRTVDVGSARAPDGRERFFINGLGLGFNGAVTLESRRIHWLRGLPLYGLAFARALLFHYATPRMEIRFDDILRDLSTFAVTVALGRREGNFVVAPQASVVDGWFDYLHAGSLSRWQVLRFMPRLASGKPLPKDYPNMWQGRARQVWVQSTAPLIVHTDGEFFSRPEDNVRDLQITLHPAALRVLPNHQGWLRGP
ncbi:MAG TPA: diacylglycerol kinase family protein [Gemmataceae bacterium]|nr:diacylglycerol kinase family protein [Gemmataceae bacterium]